MNFSQWTINDAKREIASLAPAWVQVNFAFYNGDHFQNYDGWTGPTADTTDADYATYKTAVKRVFVSKNVIAEVTDRHMAAIVGKRLRWQPVLKRKLKPGEEPTPQEQARLDELSEMLETWFNGQHGIVDRQYGTGVRLTDIHEAIQQMAIHMLLGRRGVLRLVIAPSALWGNERGDTAVPRGAPEDILEQLYIAAPPPTQAGIVTDPDTLQTCGIYAHHNTEVGGALRDCVEMVYLDDNGRTVMRRVGMGEEMGDRLSDGLELDGRLLMYQTQREELVSEQVRQLQMALNKSETGQSVNLDHAQRERIFIGITPPGTWDDEGNFTPGTLRMGAATANFLQPVEAVDPNTGKPSLASGSVNYFGPEDADVYIKSSDDYWQDILAEVDQLHVAISGDATASGKSRIEAKDDFRKSLNLTIPQVEAAGRWLFETVLKLTAVLSGNPGLYEDIAVDVTCRVDLGTPDADEVQMVSTALDKGLMSRETAVARIAGVDDVQAEIERIDADTMHKLALLEKQATVIKLLRDSGIDAALAEAVGIDRELAAKLTPKKIIPAVAPAVNGNGLEPIEV